MRRVELPVGGPMFWPTRWGSSAICRTNWSRPSSRPWRRRPGALLLHVIDCSDPAHLARIEDVNDVLRQIGADRLPLVQVYNKADILGVPPRVDRAETGMPMRVWLSAATGDGMSMPDGCDHGLSCILMSCAGRFG